MPAIQIARTSEVKSIVNGIEFPSALSNNQTYVIQAGLKGLALIKFWIKVAYGFYKANRRLKETIRKRACFYGPFKGEFGHFLAHTLPFLMYLHKRGVKINYCGMSLHKPFMVDETGNSIVEQFHELRDFFKEVPPDSNAAIPPKDVVKQIDIFYKRAQLGKVPFWDIGDGFYYWFIHRNWLSKKNTHYYQLDRAYSNSRQNSCVLLPRSKGAAVSQNNGEPWDYKAVIHLLAPFFDKIYICGHPSQVLKLEIDNPKVEIAVSADNTVLLGKLASSRLVVTQHSGIVYAGEYTGTDILMIYKGGQRIQDIGSLNNTLHFKQQFPGRSKIYYAFNENEIVDQLTTITKEQTHWANFKEE